MYYSENEAYNLWSMMVDNKRERIDLMQQIMGISETVANALDEKFTNKRNKRIWENSHPLECSRVVL